MAETHSIPEGLLRAGQKRTDEVVVRLRNAMQLMQEEISQNDGIYPQNRGRINQAEVCRRAGVSKITLQGKLHKETSKLEVDAWVAARTTRLISQIRNSAFTRAEEWKAEHSKVASQYALAMLELIEAEDKVNRLLSDRRALEQENAKLREQLALARPGHIFSFRPRDRDG